MFVLTAHSGHHGADVNTIRPYTAVIMDGENIISSSSPPLVLGEVEQSIAKELSQLKRQSRLSLQHHCSPSAAFRPCKDTKVPSLDLCTIIYGPHSLSEDVGKFLQACHIFLQDPVSCDQNARYLNPHYLDDIEGGEVWTQHLSLEPYGIEDFPTATDLLADLSGGHDLREAETPSALQTELFRYESNI
jgi:hypothetical protein